jgi:hypothetical protein
MVLGTGVKNTQLNRPTGTVRAVELQVYGKALLSSTGPLDLIYQAGNRTGLYCQQSSIQLSRDLSVIGSSGKTPPQQHS